MRTVGHFGNAVLGLCPVMGARRCIGARNGQRGPAVGYARRSQKAPRQQREPQSVPFLNRGTMRNAFIGALAILITSRTSTLVQAQTKPDEAPPTLDGAAFLTSPDKQWKLVWHDAFDGQSLDD